MPGADPAPLNRIAHKLKSWCSSALLPACAMALGWPALGQVCATQLFHGPGSGVMARIEVEGPCEVVLHDPRFAESIASARADAGEVDLLRLFPDLMTLLSGPVVYAQLMVGGRAIGSPLVIEPLRALPTVRDAWSARVVRAIESGDEGTIDSFVRMPERGRDALRWAIETDERPEAESFAVRTYEDRVVVLRTTAGMFTLALRADAAPRTAFHVRSLVEGGLFDGSAIARVDSADGQPFAIQIGDPSGSGCGTVIPFERSGLEQRLGTVSMLRHADDPNSGSGALVVWLREEPAVEVEFVGFAEIVGGGAAIREIVATRGKTLMVIDALLAPAPPFGEGREVVRSLGEGEALSGER